MPRVVLQQARSLVVSFICRGNNIRIPAGLLLGRVSRGSRGGARPARSRPFDAMDDMWHPVHTTGSKVRSAVVCMRHCNSARPLALCLCCQIPGFQKNAGSCILSHALRRAYDACDSILACHHFSQLHIAFMIGILRMIFSLDQGAALVLARLLLRLTHAETAAHQSGEGRGSAARGCCCGPARW